MPAPYSQDLRDRVIAAVAGGKSARAAAVWFGVSVSTAIRWAQRWRAEGDAMARAMGGDHSSRLKGHRAAVLDLVAREPDLSLAEIRDRVSAEHGVAVSGSEQADAQKKSLHAAEQDRPDVAKARRLFIRRQPALDPRHLLFIDETWATTNMTRRQGRAARGLRLLAPVPHGHWKVTTLVAGLRSTGITAPCVFDGAINGERFRCYIEQMLAPTLWPVDIVILDNLSSHKIAGIREVIEVRQAQILYLPPYSPGLNPIEQAFAKFKAGLRKAGERTRDGLWQAIGRRLDLYPPHECRNFLNHAGYATWSGSALNSCGSATPARLTRRQRTA
ncbi:MAG TPA: IS630 family transposase [Candidatus Binataceae bacterium]|nr:IS630 family transposase [Candidatus Binataceae bacterium]